MDPLSISQSAGQGDAVIFPSDNQDPYDIYQKDKAKRDALLAQQKAATAKIQQQRLSDLEDLNKLAVEGHVSYLDQEGDMKNKMIEKASKLLLKSNGTADIQKEIYPELTEFQKIRDTAKQTETWASQVAQTINTDHDKLDPNSIVAAKDFLKLKPQQQKEYLLKNGGFPELKHKEEFQDYNADLRTIGKQIGQVKGGGTSTDKEGNITSYTTQQTPPEHVDATADLYIQSGLNQENPNPKAAKLISDTKTLLSNDPLFNILPPEKQTEQIYQKAKEYAVKELNMVQTEENRSRISRAPSGLNFNFGQGSAENKKWRLTESNYQGTTNNPLNPEVKYSPPGKEGDIKEVFIEGLAEGENKSFPFPDPNNPNITLNVRPYSYKTVDGEKAVSVVEQKLNKKTHKWEDTNRILDYTNETPFNYEKANKRMKSIVGMSYEDYQKSQEGNKSEEIPSASRIDWQKAGWSNEQIDKGIKSGKIQLK